LMTSFYCPSMFMLPSGEDESVHQTQQSPTKANHCTEQQE